MKNSMNRDMAIVSGDTKVVVKVGDTPASAAGGTEIDVWPEDQADSAFGSYHVTVADVVSLIHACDALSSRGDNGPLERLARKITGDRARVIGSITSARFKA
jgi:hypothetical protein